MLSAASSSASRFLVAAPALASSSFLSQPASRRDHCKPSSDSARLEASETERLQKKRPALTTKGSVSSEDRRRHCLAASVPNLGHRHACLRRSLPCTRNPANRGAPQRRTIASRSRILRLCPACTLLLTLPTTARGYGH